MTNDDNAPRDIFGELIPVSTSSDNLALADEIAAGLGNVALSISSAGVGGGLPFLSISKQGFWHYGAENIKVEPNATLAIDLRSVRHGYVAWVDGRSNERMVAANEPLPPVTELPNLGADWALAISMEMVILNGEDAGVKVLYKNNSLSGRKAVLGLIEKVKRQVKLDPSKPIPIIKLDTDGYDHKKYGEIITPVFTLVGYTDGRSGPSAPAPTPPSPPPQPPQPASAQVDVAGRRRRMVG
jgi:hypothetical protein